MPSVDCSWKRWGRFCPCDLTDFISTFIQGVTLSHELRPMVRTAAKQLGSASQKSLNSCLNLIILKQLIDKILALLSHVSQGKINNVLRLIA